MDFVIDGTSASRGVNFNFNLGSTQQAYRSRRRASLPSMLSRRHEARSLYQMDLSRGCSLDGRGRQFNEGGGAK